MSTSIQYHRRATVIIDHIVRYTIFYPAKRGDDYMLYGANMNLLWRASTLRAMKRFISANSRRKS
jgi:hypothetical protein